MGICSACTGLLLDVYKRQIQHLAVAVGGAQVKAHQGGKGNDGKGAGARAHDAVVQLSLIHISWGSCRAATEGL